MSGQSKATDASGEEIKFSGSPIQNANMPTQEPGIITKAAEAITTAKNVVTQNLLRDKTNDSQSEASKSAAHGAAVFSDLVGSGCANDLVEETLKESKSGASFDDKDPGFTDKLGDAVATAATVVGGELAAVGSKVVEVKKIMG